MSEAVRELTFEEECEILKDEAKKVFDAEEDGTSEPPFANCVLRRALRCIRKLQKKYAELEDLEEQGKLLRLPCDIGTRVYKPFILVCPGKPWLFAPNIGVNYITLEDLPEVGEKIFLTRQEAEEKLDEIVKEYVASLKMEESHDRK